jgi:hypothetical protein
VALDRARRDRVLRARAPDGRFGSRCSGAPSCDGSLQPGTSGPSRRRSRTWLSLRLQVSQESRYQMSGPPLDQLALRAARVEEAGLDLEAAFTRRRLVLRGVVGALAFIGAKHLSAPQRASAAALQCPSGLSLGVCLRSANGAYKDHLAQCEQAYLNTTLEPGQGFITQLECVQASTYIRNLRRTKCKRNCPRRAPKQKSYPPDPHKLPPPPPPPKGGGGPCDTCAYFCLPCAAVATGRLCCYEDAKPDDPNPCCPKS